MKKLEFKIKNYLNKQFLVALFLLILFFTPQSVLANSYESFSEDEMVELSFDFSKETSPQNLKDKVLTFLKLQKYEHQPGKVTLQDSEGREWFAQTQVSNNANGQEKVTLDPPEFLKPGVYKVRSEYIVNGKTYIKEQDFAWGVLAINTNKSIYLPNENAFISIAVLDEKGKMDCNAKVELKITHQQGEDTLSTDNGSIVVNNSVCQAYELHDKPDYFANYQVKGAGKYKMTLSAQTRNGSFTVNDDFEVRDSVDFDIERNLATRIFPPKLYPVNLTVKANKDYKGEVIESLPANFLIDEISGEGQIKPGQDIQQIIWQVDFKKGETYNLNYYLLFPQVSPEFYLMGPLQIGDFKEIRQWQIAADAVALVQSASNSGANAQTVSVASGQGWAEPTTGNLIVGICAARTNATMAMNTPTGMSSLSNQTSGTTLGHRLFYKIATVGDTESTLTCSGPGANTRMIIEAYEYSGVDTSSPLETSDATGTGTGTSPVTNSVNTTTNNDRVVGSIAVAGSTNGTISFGSWTNSYSEGSGGANGDVSAGASTTRLGLGSADLNKTPAGSTSTGATLTNVGGSDPYVSAIAAFKPATISISGNVYDDEATTAWVPCDGTTANISLSVNGATAQTTTCADSDGAYSFTGQQVSAGDVIVVFMNATNKGVVYTKANNGTSDITANVRKNRVWIQSEQAANFTNANINTFDQSSTGGGNIPAASDGTNLTVDSGVKIVIDSSKTFAPGGNVTADSLEIKGTYTGASETLTLLGSGTNTTCTTDPGTVMPLCINSGTFTPTSNTTKFQGTSASQIENTTYNTLTFDPTISGNITYTMDGAVNTNGSFTVNPTAASALRLTVNLGGTLTVAAAGTLTISGTTSGVSTVDTISGSNYSINAGKINIASAGTFTANNSTITLTGTSSTLFTRSGTFNQGQSTVQVQTDNAVTLTSGTITFYNLALNPTITTGRTYTLGSGALTIQNNFTINPGTAANLLTVNMGANIGVTGTTQITRTTSATALLDTTASNYNLTSGKLQIDTGGTFTPRASTVIVTGSGTGTSRPFYINGGTFTAPSSSGTFEYQGSSSVDVQSTTYTNLTFNGGTFTLMAGGVTTANAGNLTITQGVLDTSSGNNYPISVNGSWSNSGTFTARAGTVTFTSTASGKTLDGTMTGGSAFYDIEFNGSGGGWAFNWHAEVTHDFTITLGTVTAPSGNLTIGRNFAHSGGSFTHNSGTVIFNDNSVTSAITGATTFNNLSSTTAGKTLTFEASTIFTFAGTFTITGDSGSRIHVHSGTTDVQWLAHFDSAQSSVTYAHLHDAGCDAGTSNVTLDSSTQDGNNNGTCWVFPPPESQTTIQGGVQLRGGTKLGS